MKKICVAHAECVHTIFQDYPQRSPDWDRLRDKERAKRIRLLRLHYLVELAVAYIGKDNDGEYGFVEKRPRKRTSHNTSPRTDCGMRKHAALDIDDNANNRTSIEVIFVVHQECMDSTDQWLGVV